MNSTQAPIQSLVNGKSANSLSLQDRGIAYGDGVFRTLLVIRGVPQHWAQHYQKLSQDCAAINIRCPETSTLLGDIQALFDQADGVAKIIITRGESARGYGYSSDIQANRIVIKSALTQYPATNITQGVKLHLCQLRLSHQPKLAGIKHLNRLENVLARSEWDDASVADGLLLDANEYVIECTMSNVFAKVGNQLIAPLLDQCGVAGVTRQRVIDNASHLGLTVSEERLSLAQLMQADEILICNSLFGVWQVTEFNNQHWEKQSTAGQLNALLEQAS